MCCCNLELTLYNGTDSFRPANPHGFTVRLIIWGINSQSHGVTSKSQSKQSSKQAA